MGTIIKLVEVGAGMLAVTVGMMAFYYSVRSWAWDGFRFTRDTLLLALLCFYIVFLGVLVVAAYV